VEHLTLGAPPEQFLALHDLAAGIERLCKGVIWIGEYTTTGAQLTTQDFRELFRHNISQAMTRIPARCFPPDYRATPIGRDDYNFLTTDPLLFDLLDLLSNFGSGGRYFDLDVVGGSASYGSGLSPSDRLDDIANDLMNGDPALRAAVEAGSPEGERQFQAALIRSIRETLVRLVKSPLPDPQVH
jgi:hypothetical protein